MLIKTDATGDTSNGWIYYSNDVVNVSFNDVAELADGDFVITGYEEDANGGDNDILIERIDANGSTIIYSEVFDHDGKDDEGTNVYTDGNSYYIAGFITTATNDKNAYLAKIDVTDNFIVWDEEYSNNSNDNEFLDFDFTADGGFICVGYAGDDVYLVKTDENGQVHNSVPTSVLELSNKLNVTAFPNPCYDALTINTASIQSSQLDIALFDLTGRQVITWNNVENKGSEKLNVFELPVGIYLLQVKTANEIYNQKITKQQ